MKLGATEWDGGRCANQVPPALVMVGGHRHNRDISDPLSEFSCGSAWPVTVRLAADGSAFFARFSTVSPGAPWTVGAAGCAPGAVYSVVVSFGTGRSGTISGAPQ